MVCTAVFTDVLPSSWPGYQRSSVYPVQKIGLQTSAQVVGEATCPKFIQSFLFQFLFIPTSKGTCQFLRLLRILQGRFDWFSTFSTVGLGFSVFRAANSSFFLPVSKVMLLLLPILSPLHPPWPDLVDLCLKKKKKSLYCAFGGVARGRKIGCMYLIYFLPLLCALP